MELSCRQLELFSDEEVIADVLVSEAGSSEERESKTDEASCELLLTGLDEACLTRHVASWLLPLQLAELMGGVHVKWNSRLQTTAGRAHYAESRIELNPRLIEIADLAEIEQTLKHELAHLVAYERCGKLQRRRLQPHGVEWREACVDLGISGEARCHELALPGRRIRRKFAYTCPACTAVIERVRKIKGYVSCYPCCRQYSAGRYDRRFQLLETRL
ncbi:MAG: SprT-like domain-containing protein [Verrucomicrobiota bacterium]